jgi:hypothetical protein
MPSKHYGWHKRWTLMMSSSTSTWGIKTPEAATHETGFKVTFGCLSASTEGASVQAIVYPLNPEETRLSLTAKHGHNAEKMVQRLVKEAHMLASFAIRRELMAKNQQRTPVGESA